MLIAVFIVAFIVGFVAAIVLFGPGTEPSRQYVYRSMRKELTRMLGPDSELHAGFYRDPPTVESCEVAIRCMEGLRELSNPYFDNAPLRWRTCDLAVTGLTLLKFKIMEGQNGQNNSQTV